ncbi:MULTISPECIES: D-glycero-beta-D-manno-heptose-7-phosphate kinase [unclassified Gluconobacter]|uniref:D-glycero-beta-D-manno-heptose-7-phosphate kinase n=1 Tax=unclassified Gluconobacter TaxID=2644261 RepID=UPI001C055401|nr:MULTISPECIES: D-glycero-beta-D-manno-heptose-7-phosphate kinase [unclassified Gluconobacter]
MIENFLFKKIVVVGDVLLDRYITGAVNRISPEAPVPVVLRSGGSNVPGGAANVAVNAAALGCPVNLIGVVGRDENADTLRRSIASYADIDMSALVEVPNWPTISKTRVMSSNQQIVRIDEEVVVDFDADIKNAIIAATLRALEGASVLVCSDYAKGVLSPQVLSAIIEAAREKNIPVIVDPKSRDFSIYRGASLVTPNRAEAAQATGLFLKTDDDVLRAASVLSGQFGGDVLLTRSEEGMTLWQRDGHVFHQSVRKSEVFDVSGAGDTVLATVAAVISAGHDLDTAVVMATLAASIAVGKVGTVAVSRDELSHALSKDMGSDGRVASLEMAKSIVSNWRRHGASVVFTNGCFDLVHPGHVSLMRAAAAQGDKLVVGLNSDASVRRLKGETRPVQSEDARAMVVSALRDVDLVVIFDEDTPLHVIETLVPDVLVKGADYAEEDVVGGDVVKAAGGKVVLANLVDGCSTSNIVRKLKAPN